MYLLYYKVFGSKDISMGDAQKHLSLANADQTDQTFYKTCYIIMKK